MPPKRKIRSVALIYDAKLPYDVNVISCVAAYAQNHSHGNIHIE